MVCNFSSQKATYNLHHFKVGGEPNQRLQELSIKSFFASQEYRCSIFYTNYFLLDKYRHKLLKALKISNFALEGINIVPLKWNTYNRCT